MRVTFSLTKISDVVKHAMNRLFTVWNDEKGEVVSICHLASHRAGDSLDVFEG
jgi:hypothetical protein